MSVDKTFKESFCRFGLLRSVQAIRHIDKGEEVELFFFTASIFIFNEVGHRMLSMDFVFGFIDLSSSPLSEP